MTFPHFQQIVDKRANFIIEYSISKRVVKEDAPLANGVLRITCLASQPTGAPSVTHWGKGFAPIVEYKRVIERGAPITHQHINVLEPKKQIFMGMLKSSFINLIFLYFHDDDTLKALHNNCFKSSLVQNTWLKDHSNGRGLTKHVH